MATHLLGIALGSHFPSVMRYALLIALSCCAVSAEAQTLLPDSTYAGSFVSYHSSAPEPLDADIDSFDRVTVLSRAGGGGGPRYFSLRRTLSDGRLDTSFQAHLALPTPALYTHVTGELAVSPEGTVTLAGSTFLGDDPSPTPFLARFDPAGRPDTTLGAAGIRWLPALPGRQIGGIAIDGARIYVTFDSWTGTSYACTVAAFDGDGEFDPTFGDEGLVSVAPDEGDCSAQDILVGPNGVWVLARTGPWAASTPVVVSLMTDGTPRGSFGDGGIARLPRIGESTSPHTLFSWEGRLVVGSLYTRGETFGLTLYALTPRGALDATFGRHGVHTLEVPGRSSQMQVGLSEVAGGALVATTSYAIGSGWNWDYGIAATAVTPNGRVASMGAEDTLYTRIVSPYNSRSLPYRSGKSVADSEGRLIVAGTLVHSGSEVGGDHSKRYLLVLPADTPRVVPATVLTVSVAPSLVRERATVSLTLPSPGPVRVSMVDALGRTVRILTDASLATGPSTFDLDASALAPGSYFVIAQTATERSVSRVLILR